MNDATPIRTPLTLAISVQLARYGHTGVGLAERLQVSGQTVSRWLRHGEKIGAIYVQQMIEIYDGLPVRDELHRMLQSALPDGVVQARKTKGVPAYLAHAQATLFSDDPYQTQRADNDPYMALKLEALGAVFATHYVELRERYNWHEPRMLSEAEVLTIGER